MRGLFISFEGIDGCGKSTQCARLVDWLRSTGIEPVVVREPGGTPVGERVRALLLDPDGAPPTPHAEALLYAASRAQLVASVIDPAIAAGRVVIADRFVDSSLAYQGAGRELGVADIARVNAFATGGTTPDVTLLIDVRPTTAAQRLATTGGDRDRVELAGGAFFDRVAASYDDLAHDAAAADRIRRIDGERSANEVWNDVRCVVAAALEHAGVAAHGTMQAAT